MKTITLALILAAALSAGTFVALQATTASLAVATPTATNVS